MTSLVHRGAADRFHTRLDWLDSFHSFAFGHHDDRRWRGYGPLRVINDDTIAPGRGFGLHPHRDMEIITVMVAGRIDHSDSLGHRQILERDEVQRLSAGTGIHHSEINGGDRACRLLQIWIEPDRPGLTPSYEQRHFDIGPTWCCLVSPAAAAGGLTIAAPIRLWRARPTAGQSLSLPLAPGTRGWIQVIDGALEVTALEGAPGPGLPLAAGDGLGFAAGLLKDLRADPEADLLLFELPPA